MARKPARKSAPQNRKRAAEAPQRLSGDPRQRIVDAFMKLAADAPLRDIGLADIARESGVSLARLRGIFGSKLAILAAFSRGVDEAVLAKGEAEGETT